MQWRYPQCLLQPLRYGAATYRAGSQACWPNPEKLTQNRRNSRNTHSDLHLDDRANEKHTPTNNAAEQAAAQQTEPEWRLTRDMLHVTICFPFAWHIGHMTEQRWVKVHPYIEAAVAADEPKWDGKHRRHTLAQQWCYAVGAHLSVLHSLCFRSLLLFSLDP